MWSTGWLTRRFRLFARFAVTEWRRSARRRSPYTAPRTRYRTVGMRSRGAHLNPCRYTVTLYENLPYGEKSGTSSGLMFPLVCVRPCSWVRRGCKSVSGIVEANCFYHYYVLPPGSVRPSYRSGHRRSSAVLYTHNTDAFAGCAKNKGSDTRAHPRRS